MLMRYRIPAIILCTCTFSFSAFSQDSSGSSSNPLIPSKYFESASKKASQLEQKLDKKSEKALRQLQKREEQIKKKLVKIDSLAADNVFANVQDKYKQLGVKLKASKKLTQYLPSIDTLATSLRFLEQNQQWLSEAKEVKEKLIDAISKVKELETKLQKAEEIRQFMRERRQYMKEQLEEFGFAKELKKLNKQVYYFSQQINEYKAILNDPKKIERRAIDLLSKSKFFQDFMQKNSTLASLFRLPADPNDPANLANLSGLQTRAQVNQLIQQQIGAGGSNAMAQVRQNLQNAQTQLNELKGKINQFGGGSSDMEMPDFKPNNQKVRSFWKRIELNSNVQSVRSNRLLPVITDLALGAGFRISDNSLAGIGFSQKIGWGQDIRNIRLSWEGLSFRSFADIRLKASIWVSAGYEMHYLNRFNRIDQLRDYNSWVQSGLVGISKKYQISKKFKGSLQLMWDYLSYQQSPRSEPLLFRVGYNF